MQQVYSTNAYELECRYVNAKLHLLSRLGNLDSGERNLIDLVTELIDTRDGVCNCHKLTCCNTYLERDNY